MRIISGEYGGRRLKSLSGETTRPTTDKVKESIFNMIGPYFDGGISLDLYAGSGALSIEAVSRGMNKAILFEKDRKAQQIILANIDITKEPEKFELIKGDSKTRVSAIRTPVDLVFLDPPYQKQTIVKDIENLIALNLIKQTTIIVCETDSKVILPKNIGYLKIYKRQEYGTIAITIYEVES